MPRTAIAVTAVLLAASVNAAPANAEGVADFYKGKQVRLVIGYPAGSGSTSMLACWRGIWASIFPGSRVSFRRTWKAPRV